MEKDGPNGSTTGAKTLTVREHLERHIPFTIMSSILIGFLAGIGAYRGLLEITNQETVVKGTVVAKKDLVGPVLKTTVKVRIEALIQEGETVQGDKAKTTVWLMQVLAFIHTLKLEKDSGWRENPNAPILKISAVEADIRYALLDPSIQVQAQKTRGVLKGFRDGLESIE